MPEKTATELLRELIETKSAAVMLDVTARGYPKLLAALEANACTDGNEDEMPCCVARRALADARAALQEALNDE